MPECARTTCEEPADVHVIYPEGDARYYCHACLREIRGLPWVDVEFMTVKELEARNE